MWDYLEREKSVSQIDDSYVNNNACEQLLQDYSRHCSREKTRHSRTVFSFSRRDDLNGETNQNLSRESAVFRLSRGYELRNVCRGFS